MSYINSRISVGPTPASAVPPDSGIRYFHTDDFTPYSIDENGVVTQLAVSASYSKNRVIVTTPSPNFNSNTPTDVPGLSFVIPKDGDYVFHTVVNINSDQNEGAFLYLAVDGVTDTDSEVGMRMQKNDDESISITYDIDGLSLGQIITVQLNTNADNMDLNTRRLLAQSWG